MEKIEINGGQFSISRLVYGTWRLADDANQSSKHILNKIELCLKHGITTIDHADIYGDYSCEALFGKALKDAPDLNKDLVHISKCDIMLISDKYPDRKVKYYDTSAKHIQASVESSLSKIGVDCLDILLLHRPDPLMNADETAAALDELIQVGKVKAVGVSNFKSRDMSLLQSRMKNPIVTNQIEMSVLCNESFLDGTLAYLQEKSILPMAWSPLAGGRLFGNESKAVEVQKVIEQLASKIGVPADTYALAWLLNHPAGIIPVVGTNNPERLRRICESLPIKISREDWYQIWTANLGSKVP